MIHHYDSWKCYCKFCNQHVEAIVRDGKGTCKQCGSTGEMGCIVNTSNHGFDFIDTAIPEKKTEFANNFFAAIMLTLAIAGCAWIIAMAFKGAMQ